MSKPPTDLRLQLLRLGYLPLPLYGKEPPTRKNNKSKGLSDWPNLRATPDKIFMWDKVWPDASNTGVITAPVPTFDGDITHPEAARAVEDLVRERYEEVGHVLVRFGNPPKFAIPFRTDEPFEKLSVYLKAQDGSRHKIEFLCKGQQVVVDGIHPDTGKPYGWHGGTLVETPREELPSITKAEAQQLVDDAVDLLVRDFEFTRVNGDWMAPSISQRAIAGRGKILSSFDSGGESFFKNVNSYALENLDRWVPDLFGSRAEYQPRTGAYRISSKALGRNLQEDLSISPRGIKDWGVWDMGDPRMGKRTPIDLVLEFGARQNAKDAALWLCERTGVSAESLGWGRSSGAQQNAPAAPSVVPSQVADAPPRPVDLWGVFTPPVLPTGSLPKVIEDFARVQATIMGADPAGLAVSALVVAGAAIKDSISLQVKEHSQGWTEEARIWGGLIGDPSTKKTPIIREAERPLRKIDLELWRQYVDAMARYNALDKDDKKGTEPPPQVRVRLEDTTIEAAQEVLKDSPGGVLLLQDELSGFFGSMDKYNSHRGAAKDRGFWLQAWNGGPYAFNRIGRGPGLVPNLSVSLLGGIQPDLIRKLAADAHDDGMLQRMFPIVLRPAVLGSDEPIPAEADDYARVIDRLYQLTPASIGFWGTSGSQTRLVFDAGAQAIRQDLERKNLDLAKLETVNKKLAAHIGKYDGLFARLCVIWHCVENCLADKVPRLIPAKTAQRVADFLHKFLLPHAVAFYGNILGLADDHDRLAAVAGYILARKLERVTNRDVARGDRTMRRLTKRETEEVFEQLEALGWLTGRKPGKRPSDPPHWVVNPECHQLFAKRAEAEAARRSEARDLIKEFVNAIP